MKKATVTEPSRSVVYLTMSGEFDISTRDSLNALLLPGETADEVVIDMSGTTYLDSSALHCLAKLKKHLTSRGEGTVRLVGAPTSIRRILAITGLDSLFDISDQREPS